MTPQINPSPTPHDPAPRPGPNVDLSAVELAVIEQLEIEPAEFIVQRARQTRRGAR